MWWQGDCSAMIGIVTAVSPLSRVLVIDIDTKPGKPNGWESIFHLMEQYEPLPETTGVITPSGGTHLYYAMPEGEPPLRCRVGWLPGVDIPWLMPSTAVGEVDHAKASPIRRKIRRLPIRINRRAATHRSRMAARGYPQQTHAITTT